ncbi:MAG: tRNA threonylcarbamoyladenosine biosynthesis protein TsaB [Alphaproteobacteria bacterium]|jgi:tRNA threonylcarbamoyladenosine biosynthesis protein TsaB
MNILALDSATSACSVAVWKGDGIASRRMEKMTRGHAVRLMPMAQEAMADAGLAFDQLDMVATTIGPGGFTGLRIGLAGARAIAMAAAIPIIGFTTFQVIAHQSMMGVGSSKTAGPKAPLLVVLDARRSDFYFQIFGSDGSPVTQPAAASVDAIAAAIAAKVASEASNDALAPEASNDALAVCGDGADLIMDALRDQGARVHRVDGPDTPDAATVATLAYKGAPWDPMSPPEPLYLRPPDAALPRLPARPARPAGAGQ